ncbi:MAG TPA: SGNH/GDSL hydrolase family protein [Sphingomonas sp.]|nr:SGNH/GDSL hydrolase family protein [Sphingomonas sp.]
MPGLLAGLAAAMAVGAAVPLPQAGSTYTIAANGTAIPADAAAIDAGSISRIEHHASPQAAISDLRFIEANWYFGPDQRPHEGAARRVRAWLEYPQGRFHPIHWQSGATLDIAPGGHALSDPVAVTIPAGARFWTRWVNAGNAVPRWPMQVLPAPPAAIGRSDGNAPGGRGDRAGVPVAQDATAFFGPAAILGTVHRRGARGGVIVGDSIAFGIGDVTGSGSAGGSGYVARALDPLFAYTRIARGGQQATDLAADTALPRRFLALLRYSDVVFEHGINDLRLGRTPEQVLGAQRTIRDLFDTRARQWQATLTPRTLSVDGYRSAAGQTPKGDGTMTSLGPVNAAIRAERGPTLQILEAADAAMTHRDSGIWGGPWPPVLDGTHPTSAKAAALADAVRPSIARAARD